MAHLSKPAAYIIFAAVLISYTIQCELAAYLNRVGYAKPFFLLYCTHSSYMILGGIHYLGFKLIKQPLKPMLLEMQQLIKGQLGVGPKSPFPTHKAAQRLLLLSVLIALPAGVWYAAIPYAAMTSLTALYNLNAFWAYILSIYWSKSERWEFRSAMAVGIACLGVLVMTYGDSGGEEPPLAGSEGDLPARAVAEDKGQVGSLFGDLLGLFASFLVGLYEVWYKRYIALPAKTEAVPLVTKRASYSRLLPDGNGDGRPLSPVNDYSTTESAEGNGHAHKPMQDHEDEHEPSELDAELQEIELEMNGSSPHHSSSMHSTLLFMTHANFITFAIGITTFLLFWLPLPFLHWFDIEPFGLPRDLSEFLAVAGVCFGGVIFNAGFMILLANWGPVVTSVGNLFTLILVAGSDEVIAILNGYNSLSISTLVGSGFILASFGLLMTAPNTEEEETHKRPGHARTQSLPHAMP
ncbi:hypothetical protein P389DRAFT_165159 [Cystobasidium minutum MCA 4210]|uniref:uncharacterized protein n=1 Tax=Cystobasidium minutum MCA 4210 TaxID=1397322 RepID=UPI0034CD784A|eukprot:jgi/Rhomi1/165159/fgenesh1_kg.1_\